MRAQSQRYEWDIHWNSARATAKSSEVIDDTKEKSGGILDKLKKMFSG